MTVAPHPIAFSDVEALFAPSASSGGAAKVQRLVVEGQMPLVLSSARTRAELEFFLEDLRLRHPFVCESGAAVYIPDGYFTFNIPAASKRKGFQVIEYGRPHADVVRRLDGTVRRVGMEIVTFRDLSVEDVASECQLPLLEARLAKMREYGEPFRIVNPEPGARGRLFSALRSQGLRCFRAGRYEYVDAPADEATGIALLCECYRRALGTVVTVGLGDRDRDARLLALVQIPLMVHLDASRPPERLRKPQGADLHSAPASWRWNDFWRRLRSPA